MNWKLLGTMTALIGVGASIALAQGTAPTIVQGDYISNVFGNSNFIKNPNAKLNTKDVTTVTATVTRSTTTPLVATSEFNVAIGTANGTATWATRAFDAGMKGQNCEARFTYRGFAATSKVHIKQGANTVATLNLTPATDPRIASINFPCGDLSTATTFVVTDTAILAGTNEIGGIYTGLATNMANVAQAEEAGKYTMTGATSCNWSTGSTSLTNYSADADCNTATVTGAATTSAGKIPGATFSNLKPGKYVFMASFLGVKSGAVVDSVQFRMGDGTTYSGVLSPYVSANTGQFYMPVTAIFTTEYTTVSSPTIQIQAASTASGNVAEIPLGNSTLKFEIIAYRFPTSSELVVTPERQNTFAGVVHTSGNQTLHSGSAEPTTFSSYNSATWNQPTRLKGKAAVTTTNSGNDLGFSVPNLPVGNYEMKISGAINSVTGGSGFYSVCNLRVRETTTDSTVIAYQHNGESTTGSGTRDYVTSGVGIFTNNSVATRNFILEASKFADTTSTNNSGCEVFTNSSPTGASYNTYVTMTITPLDQPSNSALYVEGPVKASATGAAIPAGYVGETIVAEQNSFTSGLTNGSTVGLVNITLTPGTWLISASQSVVQNGSTGTAISSVLSDVSATGNTITGLNASGNDIGTWPPNNTTQSTVTHPSFIYSTSTSKTIYLNTYSVFSAGTPQRRGTIRAVRIN